ncbi:MAG: type III-B CRISPR-associated protein Cas10/Cmr2 [Synergistales bacterium]|nr:type III-B CRISPR-associated protein Cas10/Cmr2 [Synergistales bacterium]
MSGALLALSIGPVQEFIAAARRTRDLWFGSYLLSEVAKAAALGASEAGAELIFPAAGDKELRPADPKEEDTLSVANVILAEIRGNTKVEDVRDAARKAAERRWRDFADQARQIAGGAVAASRWDRQVEDVIEFYAAWTPLNGTGYQAARKRVMRLLAGRKACRDFRPHLGSAGIHKSSLDGGRESVLQSPRDRLGGGLKRDTGTIRGRMRLKAGEELDAVGLVKRLAGGRVRFPSVSRVAADPWIRGIREGDLEELSTACGRIPGEMLSRVPGGPFEIFPYEGTVLFPTRHAQMVEESTGERPGGDGEALNKALEGVPALVDRLIRSYGEPFPYLAVLAADGDHMGALLSEKETPHDHREFSGELSRFAIEARKEIKKHNGVAVYTGGDDVLAFLPVDQAVDCADKLRKRFADIMEPVAKGSNAAPTLSAGISIAHCLEDLEDLLDFGRKAESLAKGKKLPEKEQRNGLAVVVRSRGNAPTTFRAQWTDPRIDRLQEWVGHFLEGERSNKLPYELRRRAGHFRNWTETEGLEKAIRADLRLVLSRKVKGELRLGDDDIERICTGRDAPVDSPEALADFAEELLVARQIAEAKRLAERRRRKEDA